jgi:hypothetical protein
VQTDDGDWGRPPKPYYSNIARLRCESNSAESKTRSLQLPVVASQEEREKENMNVSVSEKSSGPLYLTVIALLLAGAGLADTAVISWSASVVTVGEILAAAFTFVLIAAGVFFTTWLMTR